MRLLLPTALALVLSACASGPTVTSPGAPAPGSSASQPAPTRGLSREVSAATPGFGVTDAAAADDEVGDVWARIRAGLTLDRRLEVASVREKLAFYARKQEFLDRVSERATPYLFHIVEELEKRRMPPELALLPIVESAFQPFAYSRSRASGIWQFIPGTGTRYGLKQNWWYDGRRDIIEATRAALDYLEKLNAEFNGDWLLALAAYNAGEMNVQRAVEKNRRAGHSTDFFSLRLPRETRGYVPSLLAVTELLANAEEYGLHWQPIPNRDHFAIVPIDGQIELETAARLAGIGREEFRNLNPGFSQWATDPDGPHRLLVPVNVAESFAQQVAALPPMERVRFVQHVVRGGESLGGISHKYGTTVAALQQANNLRGTLIRTGQVLTVPRAGTTGTVATAATSTMPVAATRAADGMHTVARGENLWTIGRRHGVTVAQLCEWNNLDTRSTLHPGQRIRVDAAGALLPGTPVAMAVAYNVPAPQAPSYVVRQGDSLWQIARRFGVSVAQLQQWNSLKGGSVLRPGQTLIVAQPDAGAQGA